MICWICRLNEADSGEHRVKRSDISAVLGSPTQRQPLKLHTTQQVNLPVGSLNSDRLKLKGVICYHCNTTLTQPYDRAWEAVSEVVRAKIPSVSAGETLSFSSIASGDRQLQMLRVHLFFVKVFGCHIAAHALPIPLGPFSEALVRGTAHPQVFLRFGRWRGPTHVGMSDIHLLQHPNGNAAFAAWFYTVAPLNVNVMFSLPGEQRRGLQGAWHPSDNAAGLIVADFEED